MCLWILMWEDKKWQTFSLEEVLLRIMDCYFGQKAICIVWSAIKWMWLDFVGSA